MEISSRSWLNLNPWNFQLLSHTIVHTLRLMVSKSATNEVLEAPVVQPGEDARALSPCHPQLQAWNSRQDNELFIGASKIPLSREWVISGAVIQAPSSFPTSSHTARKEAGFWEDIQAPGPGLWALCVWTLGGRNAVWIWLFWINSLSQHWQQWFICTSQWLNLDAPCTCWFIKPLSPLRENQSTSFGPNG